MLAQIWGTERLVSQKEDVKMSEQNIVFPRVKTEKGWFFGDKSILDIKQNSQFNTPQIYIDYHDMDVKGLHGFETVCPFDDCFALCGKNQIIIYDICKLKSKKDSMVFRPKMTLNAKIKPVAYKADNQSPTEHYAIEKLYDMGFDEKPRDVKYRFFQHTLADADRKKFDTGFIVKTGIGNFVWYLINSVNGNFRMVFIKDYKIDFTQIEIRLNEMENCLSEHLRQRNEYINKQYGNTRNY